MIVAAGRWSPQQIVAAGRWSPQQIVAQIVARRLQPPRPMLMPDFSAAAASFDEARGLPDAIAAELRDVVLARLPAGRDARLLETGIGTGRIAAPFVAAGCRYVGVDRSPAMLTRCRDRFSRAGGRRWLVRADIRRLPFPDATFDAVLAASVYRAAAPWREAAAEADRVLTRPGTLFLVQHEVAPGSMEDMLRGCKREVLARLGAGDRPPGGASDDEVAQFFAARGAAVDTVRTAPWTMAATARACIARHLRGSRVANQPWAGALGRELEAFAIDHYGSLEAEEAVTRTLRIHAIHMKESGTDRNEPTTARHGMGRDAARSAPDLAVADEPQGAAGDRRPARLRHPAAGHRAQDRRPEHH